MPIRLLPLSDHGRHYFETSVTDGDDNDRDVNIADDGFPDTEGSSREEEKYEEALEPAIIYLHPIIYSTCKRCLAMLLRVDLTSIPPVYYYLRALE